MTYVDTLLQLGLDLTVDVRNPMVSVESKAKLAVGSYQLAVKSKTIA